MKRFLTLLLTAVMLCGLTIPAMAAENTILVVGSEEFNGLFSPFFAATAYDRIVNDYIQAQLYRNSPSNEDIAGLSEVIPPVVSTDEQGNTTVVYTFKIRDGAVFSNGDPVTADDVIFTYKVFCDPMYDGATTIFALPIVGVKEYRADSLDPDTELAAQQAQADAITDEEILAYIAETAPADVAGATLADESIREYIVGELGGEEALAAKLTELGTTEADATADQVAQLYVGIEQTNYFDNYKPQAVAAKLSKIQQDALTEKLASGVQVPEIEGIKKIDEKTVEVTLNSIDPTAAMNLGRVSIASVNYYGKDFTKGNLKSIKDLNRKPMGAGSYTFESFENNVVTLRANPTFYLGEPKIPTLRYQKLDEEKRFEAVVLGEVDIADPAASPEVVADAEAQGLYPALVDNNGYGYIGINAALVPDINVRKALMHMLNRKPAVDSYYGDLATIIERPISRAMWAYPEGATEYYGYDLEKAKEYFTEAGYELKDGKLVKDGQQFKLEAWLSSSTHPVVPVFNQLKTDLEAMGAVCDIISSDWTVYNEAYRAGTIQMWAAAWGNGADPDMYQIYHSSQIETGNNPYRINSPELDELIVAGRSTLDQAERKEIYTKALDLVMDYACEMPFYQRMNLYLINPEVVNIETLPEQMSPFAEWFYTIETLELM